MRKILAQHQFDVEPTTCIRRARCARQINKTTCSHHKMFGWIVNAYAWYIALTGTVDERLYVGDVGIVYDDSYTFRRIFNQFF